MSDQSPAAPIDGLSASIICKNNVATIGHTLASIAPLVSEIVAVDSGSTDGTLDLLEQFGARVIRSDWLGYTATNQRAIEATTGTWVLSIDSDESVEPDLAESIRAALTHDDLAIAGYAVNRKVWYAGRFLEHAWQPEWRVRLVRRGLIPQTILWGGLDPHYELRLIDQDHGRFGRLAGTLRHDTIASMTDFLAGQVRLSSIAAMSLIEGGSRASRWRLATSPAGAFLKQMVLKGAWRDGWRGWCAAGATAGATLIKHTILLDLQGREGESRDESKPQSARDPDRLASPLTDQSDA